MNLLPCGPFLFSVSLLLLGKQFQPELAQTVGPAGRPAQSWGQVVGCVALLAVIGILLVIVGCKLFDQCVPGEPPDSPSK